MMTTPRMDDASVLREPVRFAAELERRLALPLPAGFDTSFATYSEQCARLREIVGEQPEAVLIITTLENALLHVGQEQYSAGVRAGAASEYLRRALIEDGEAE